MKKTEKPMSWKFVETDTAFVYPNGLRVGDKLQLLRTFETLDHLKRPIECHEVGEVWVVAAGSSEEPDVIWLVEPDGELHGWRLDESFDSTFVRVTTEGKLQ